MERFHYPFVAVLGQDKVKKALILNVINPRIGGVLICGEKGTAKSTLVRGLAEVMESMSVIDLPLNITEDRLIGSIDIEDAIRRGTRIFEPGILQKADGNILYIDEVNLLSEHIVNCLLEVAASGINIIEREGVSHQHRTRFLLVGTMNPEEGGLHPQFIDRFGLYTEVHGESDRETRMQIIRRRMDFEKDAEGFRHCYEDESRALRTIISQTQQTLPEVKPVERDLLLAAMLAREAACAGHRAEITIIETARALAAFAGRNEMTSEDIREAASFALPHRMRELTSPSNVPHHEETNPQAGAEGKPNSGEDNEQNLMPGEGVVQADTTTTPPLENGAPGNGNNREKCEDPAGSFDIHLDNMLVTSVRRQQGSGKRARVKSGSCQGRYIKYRLPRGKVTDLAFDATLRAAAPYQLVRKQPGLALVIKPPDMREKVKEKHTGCVVLFVVDASGSMGARRRMGAVKGAVLSLLGDAYRKRDRVGVIAFRDHSATMLLGITRSIDLAHKCLKELPTGGKTPLSAGLAMAYQTLKTAKIREPDILPYLVLVTDGRTNVSMNGCSPLEDALAIARKLHSERIHSMVFDTEDGYITLGLASKIAEVLDAGYIKLDDISAVNIRTGVNILIT